MINRKEILVQAIENGFEETLEGYPIETKYSKEKNATDYTIFGNTEYSENLFNYTEPKNKDQQVADENGWFDVTVDNSAGTATKYVPCYTSINNQLNTDTTYYILVEIAEISNDVKCYAISNNITSTSTGQFVSNSILSNTVGIQKLTNKTRTSFDNCANMLRTIVFAEAGQSGHIKFRIAVYETQKDEFIPYIKTSVGDLTDNLFNYTEPTTNSVQADENGWFDVTVDNTTGTATKTVWCTTKPNYRLKTNTQYALFVEVAEKSGSVNNVVATQWSSFPSQLLGGTGTTIVANSIGTKTATVQTRASFDDCENMLRGNVSVPAGQSGHIKFRIAVYECLPAEYQEVEYIESTGKEYIETGCLLNETSVVEIEASLKKSVPKAYGALFGSRISTTTVSGQQNALWWHNGDDENTAKLAGLIGESTYRTTDDTVQFGMFRKIRFGCDSLSIDGIKKFTFSKALYANGMNAVLFGLRTGNYVDIKRFNGKIKYCRITTDDVLVRNFIPCYRKSDNVVGMYDTVNGVFYTNASPTGSFLKGADKTYSFEPYNKYKIPIIVNDETAATAYLDAPLADGESANYKSDNLPDINLQKDINELTTDTEVKPSKISLTYTTKVRGSHE